MDERTKRELARLNEIIESEQVRINQTMSVEWQIAKEHERVRTDKVIALQRENERLRSLLNDHTAELERIIVELEESRMRVGDMSMDSSMRRAGFNSAIDRAIAIVKGKLNG
jgi:hypothetical protein